MEKSNRFETARVTEWSTLFKSRDGFTGRRETKTKSMYFFLVSVFFSKKLIVNIKEALLEEHSKAQTLRITEFIDSDPKKFDELMNLILNNEYRVVQRGSWVVRHCYEKEPTLILPYLEKVISKLRNPSHDAYKRNMLVILSEVDVPDKFIGELADICFDSLENRSEAVAIRAHAISNLYNICFKEPDLANELKLLLEEFMPHESAGFKSKAKKTITNLRKHKLIE